MRRFFFWKRYEQQQANERMLSDKQRLLADVQQALEEWKHAQRRLDYAESRDEIDYAIFALEAAEKRYEMLLRQAKHMNLHALQVGLPKAVEG
ncbi:DUF2508 family protein [Paenibacillus koleovorans]|uniref:DUF2508 family protein n=1 Tax=Paenibacillus koleovorans TaxID=121608 RepID=UPI000FD8EEE3|nr:DUF2508 family protein [Paenibacillus koleovorans]